eukprot:TRINITY_DN3812_c2_g1_i1.p1 TRINITY_DN3812_c2_g1~~TRINITY_DN3812_c2_g1_i1.p1  ORF type:complete len:1438 (+),score=279.24 TRINITY_DN3812_c2_g1_i1:547-4314(+)
MSLEDGRFLMNPKRFDSLISDEGYTKEQLEKLRIIRVHPNFRVVALALPSGKYQGNPLDPPLRSRFQARYVGDLPVGDRLEIIRDNLSEQSFRTVSSLFQFSQSIQHFENIGKNNALYTDMISSPPEFPARSMVSLINLLKLFPKLSPTSFIHSLYPYQYLNTKNQSKFLKTVESGLQRFGLMPNRYGTNTDELNKLNSYDEFNIVEYKKDQNGKIFAVVKFISSNDEVTLNIPCGSHKSNNNDSAVVDDLKNSWNTEKDEEYSHIKLLSGMLASHAASSHICLLGKKGSGKSTIVRKFAEILKYEIETQLLYKDINYREMLQRRVTNKDGDTLWENSNLVNAAIHGRLAILDNIDRLSKDALSSLQSLIIDNEVTLPDGSRLVHREHYEKLVEELGEQELIQRKIYKVHENFRLIAVGDIPTSKNDYLSLETVGLFDIHVLDALDKKSIIKLISKMVPGVPDQILLKIFEFSSKYNNTNEFKDQIFTLRQFIRTARQVKSELKIHRDGNLYKHIHRSVLSEFMPNNNRSILNDILSSCNINPETSSTTQSPKESSKLVINDENDDNRNNNSKHLIPKIEFYDNPRHREILTDMEVSFNNGHHLLLIGNQGTGKNKLTDKFLEMHSLPRQYIQLHRDTTVASLTSQPSIKDGCIVWEDSPLVRAVREGHILVVDEADKAEVEVVTILKNLVDGEMVLADGRRILSSHRIKFHANINPTNSIIIHKNFRLFVLANRPGWPFLGNNFYRECGDLFSIHAVENPDQYSEIQLLKYYDTERVISQKLLSSLTNAFKELREKYNEGILSYPYSTREIVNVVKHLSKFPNDSIEKVLENIFSFDLFNPQARQHIIDAFLKEGIDLEKNYELLVYGKVDENSNLSLMRKQRHEHQSNKTGKLSGPKHGKIDPTNAPHVGGNTWAGGSGGRDTAGLGGKGGPYRLDVGHDVYQISDEEKQNIDEEILKKARMMADEALAKRLEEINMTAYDAELYNKYFLRVQSQIQQLRIILEALQPKNNQRRWIKYQTTGDLDESRLVEGVTGEKTIYKRCANPETPQKTKFGQMEKPKRIHFIMDISASMYRFDGYDHRLQRMMETAVMIMESFEGFENQIQYMMTGHSGDSPVIPLVGLGNPPRDRNQRLQVLQQMVAHSQFCWPGDNTILATQLAIEKAVSSEESDENFVFVLSDANFERYRISPKKFGQTLTSSDKVNAYAIFIASMWENQAENLSSLMPAGHGFVCLDTSQLPVIFNKLLTSTVLQ